MQRVEYQPLIVGKEPVDEPKSCHYSFQDVTFVISLVVQLAVLIFSLVTLGIGNPPPLLQLILVLETIVQGVEFVWYLTIGALYFFRKMTFGVEYRYIDWVITTPIMLITLFFLVIYFHKPCMEVAKLVDFPGFAGLLVLIVLADWAMLFLGCMVEANWWNIRERVSYVRWLLVLGFVPLCLAFIAHIMAATERPSDSAVAVIVPTFAIWSLYGVVAIAAYGDDRAQWRNAFYNLLDLISKNLAGVVVSIIAFEAECPAAEEEATLLQSAVNLIAGANASPPPAPPPVREPNFVAGGIFLGVLGFVCVSGILYVSLSCYNFRAKEEEEKKKKSRA